MTNETWRPLIPTGRDESLTEKFPTQMREAVFRWMQGQLGVQHNHLYSHRFVEFQNALHVNLGFQADEMMSWPDEVMPHLRSIDDAHFTNLLDFLAASGHFPSGHDHPLEQILSEGGSAWTIVRWNQTAARLAKRVPDGVLESVQGVLSAKDAASRKLQEAWLDAYGTNPRASVAYFNAVVAVETAALALIDTGKSEATLGNVITVLEAPTPKWGLVLRDHDKLPGAHGLAKMMRLLWRGHASRHGSADYEDASMEEARAAVMLAATLVQWLTSGVVIPKA